MTKPRFAGLDEALDALVAGRTIIVLDSEDRENEGDLLAAAETITPQAIHFMISEARGQLCMPVDPTIARRLGLTPMVPTNDPGTPRFAVPVDHRRCTTGISPLERAFTIREMLNPRNGPEDFVRPGHIFPLLAKRGGLLERIGHTEATIDLARMAGLTPAGVLCEVCSRDGLNMALCDELSELAARFRLPMITIDAILEHRKAEAGGVSRELEVSSLPEACAAG